MERPTNAAARVAHATDFTVEVDGIGTFRFGRRSLRDEMRIGAEYSRLTEGVETPTASLELIAGWISTLKVMTVEAPKGWDIDAMDPLDDGTYTKLLKVHAAFRRKEDSFRGGEEQASKE